jgi:large subunit ribosomal protein L4
VFLAEPPALKEIKTKPVADYLRTIGLTGKKVLWVSDRTGETLLRSSRNIAKVSMAESGSLHPYSLMKCDCVVFTKSGLDSLADRLGEKA